VLLIALLAVAGAAAQGAQRTITRAQAGAVAAAISLRHSDLSTLTQQSNPITAQELRSNAAVTACVHGVPASEAYAQEQSPDFTDASGSITIDSTTEILSSASLARRDLAAVTGPRGLPCLESQLKAQLQSGVAKGDVVTVTGARLPAPIGSTDGAFMVRVAIGLRVKGSGHAGVSLYADVIGFIYGQAEVALDVLTTRAKPSSSLEQRLAGDLLARAKSAIG
jgi:hypothetical protein